MVLRRKKLYAAKKKSYTSKPKPKSLLVVPSAHDKFKTARPSASDLKDCDSALERKFLRQFTFRANADGLPLPRPQVRVCNERRYVFDFAWPDLMFAIEIQGGITSRTRSGWHTSIDGMVRDMDKLNLAQIHGWHVFQLSCINLYDKNWSATYSMIRRMLNKLKASHDE
jgi:hypothetical protein